MLRAFALAALLAASSSLGAHADCAADLAAVAARHAAAGPFRLETTFTFNGQPRKTVTEVALPDRVRQQKIGTESVTVADTMWIKQGANWLKAPARLTAADREATYLDLSDRIARGSDKTCLGPVTRDGIEHLGFRFTSTHKVGSFEAVWATELLVNRATGLPAIAEINRGTPTAFIDRYNYDKTISISSP